ncbi:hypothetical protein [Flavobacterium helocola]|uniref:Lipoprotein n=1 Tax=Flavobacterium helocola TaxID=3139139 RepID=A0ABU9I278_9FLAO
MKKILILVTGLFFACESNDLSKENKISDTTIAERQSSLYENVESTFIDNGLSSSCENNILIFPDWETYYLTIDKIDDVIDVHCDAFENSADPLLTDEQYEAYGESIGFDEDLPLREFENDLKFCSLWRKIFDMETNWLALQGDGEWDENQDPDNHFIEEDSERVLLNEGAEVIIGSKEDGYIIYKFFEWGYIEVYNNDFQALQQINATGIVPNENPNVKVFDEKTTENPQAPDCKGGVTHRKYFRTGSKTRIKTVDKMKDFRGAPGPSKSSKIKSKTKYYRKKAGVWTRGKTTLTAGFEGSYNRLNYFADWRECGFLRDLTELKTRKRSKVKKKHKGPSDMYFRVLDNQLSGVHKRRNDVIKKIDYFDGQIQ